MAKKKILFPLTRPSRPSRARMADCSLDEFRGFFLAKAFDVIGNGSYRKHIARCKDSGDPWAIAMAGHVQVLQNQIREVQGVIAAMPQTPNHLQDICRDVMMSAQPPVRLHAGTTVCSITGRRCTRCLDISKAHKNTPHVYVDPRFCFFFMLLWLCNKLEYIIRCFTRDWLDNRTDGETMTTLCERLREELEPTITKMHRLFTIGRRHVLATLAQHTHSHQFTPVLTREA